LSAGALSFSVRSVIVRTSIYKSAFSKTFPFFTISGI
jgi:hypothetical protein